MVLRDLSVARDPGWTLATVLDAMTTTRPHWRPLSVSYVVVEEEEEVVLGEVLLVAEIYILLRVIV